MKTVRCNQANMSPKLLLDQQGSRLVLVALRMKLVTHGPPVGYCILT